MKSETKVLALAGTSSLTTDGAMRCPVYLGIAAKTLAKFFPMSRIRRSTMPAVTVSMAPASQPFPSS
jgi:hypothetical protein